MPNADVPMMPVRQRVIRLISVCFEIPEADIRPTSTWQAHGADSLDLVELVMALEDELASVSTPTNWAPSRPLPT
jgi:acyl carrier protein